MESGRLVEGKDSGRTFWRRRHVSLEGYKGQVYTMKSDAQEVLAAWGYLAFLDPHVDVGAMYPQLLLPHQAWAPPYCVLEDLLSQHLWVFIRL